MSFFRAIALAAAGFPALWGQGTHIGMQVGITLPQGDAATAVGTTPGYLVGFNVQFDGASGLTFRPGLSYSSAQGSGGSGMDVINYTYQDRVSTVLLSLDAIYHPQGIPEGPYLLAGIGAAGTNLESSGGPDGTRGKFETAFAWALGGGWQSSGALGVELCYRSTRPRLINGAYYPTLNQSTFDASALTLAMTFRF